MPFDPFELSDAPVIIDPESIIEEDASVNQDGAVLQTDQVEDVPVELSQG